MPAWTICTHVFAQEFVHKRLVRLSQIEQETCPELHTASAFMPREKE